MEVKLQSENILTAYKNADEKGKQLLKDVVGDQIDFSPKITNLIKSYEDALKFLNSSEPKLSIYDSIDVQAYKQLKVIIKALNNKEECDWSVYTEKFRIKLISTGDLLVDGNFNEIPINKAFYFTSRGTAEYAKVQFKQLFLNLLSGE